MNAAHLHRIGARGACAQAVARLVERSAMEEEGKWHWAEGMKYAVEAIKAQFILNGAAAVSMLTFIGNAKMQSISLISAMFCFALGASVAVFTQWMAYLTQLHYGNSFQYPSSDAVRQDKWAVAVRWHYVTYFCAGFGLFLFSAGIGCAAIGLWPATSGQATYSNSRGHP